MKALASFVREDWPTSICRRAWERKQGPTAHLWRYLVQARPLPQCRVGGQAPTPAWRRSGWRRCRTTATGGLSAPARALAPQHSVVLTSRICPTGGQGPQREAGHSRSQGRLPARRRHFSHVQRNGREKVLGEPAGGSSWTGQWGLITKSLECQAMGSCQLAALRETSLKRLTQWRSPQSSFRHNRTQGLTQ